MDEDFYPDKKFDWSQDLGQIQLPHPSVNHSSISSCNIDSGMNVVENEADAELRLKIEYLAK